MRTGSRIVVAAALAAALLSGCARPGQLGSPLPAPTPVAPAPVSPDDPAPASLSGAVLLSSGLIDEQISVRTAGPAALAVRIVVLAPGDETGWHRHPGWETAIVRSGEVVVQRAEACSPARHTAGDGVYVDDAEPHVMRNEGTVRAELVVTHLLTPGAPDTDDVAPAC